MREKVSLSRIGGRVNKENKHNICEHNAGQGCTSGLVRMHVRALIQADDRWKNVSHEGRNAKMILSINQLCILYQKYVIRTNCVLRYWKFKAEQFALYWLLTHQIYHFFLNLTISTSSTWKLRKICQKYGVYVLLNCTGIRYTFVISFRVNFNYHWLEKDQNRCCSLLFTTTCPLLFNSSLYSTPPHFSLCTRRRRNEDQGKKKYASRVIRRVFR